MSPQRLARISTGNAPAVLGNRAAYPNIQVSTVYRGAIRSVELVMKPHVAFVCLALLTSSALAQQEQNAQTVIIGPWSIMTTSKAGKFENCTMIRTGEGLGTSFVRAEDGLLLLLNSPKWKLERGKAYSVRLTAGPQSVETKALAETKGVTIALADKPFNANLRTANVLEVRAEGATLRVPLDKSALALERLEMCFEKNVREGPETNPFVAPGRKP